MTSTSRTLSRLTFGGVLRSEWIKLRSLRSTLWCYFILIVVTIGLGALLASVRHSLPHQPALTVDAQRSFAVTAITAGTGLGQLLVAVLGTLMITGEYGTGMIRSTLAAVPKRTPALVAKVLVFGLTTLIVAAASLAATVAIVNPLLPNVGVHVNLLDARILLPALGSAGYLALLGMFSLSLGAIIRSSAGGIAASVGVVLVVPIILRILSGVTQAVWPSNIDLVLPGGAGAAMYAYVAHPAATLTKGEWALNPTEATLVMAGWVVVMFVIAAIQLKRRDA